ncbi:hypothetical protein EDD22DRAFT_971195 [Suillus occidentalis]|nr:hypothetical protein EDD22DRAFT_971195 [Suillus occidentalis]
MLRIEASRQKLSVHEQLDIARHFGHLHKHATITVPRDPGLEEVHGESGLLKGPNDQWHPSVVYNDAARRPDDCAFSKIEFWHSDMTYEIRPPSTTSLKVATGPEYGGDTLWSSGDLARLASKSVASLSKPYTLSFVSPGWKSVYVNPGVTRRMLGVPKSDIILNVLFHQVAEDVDLQRITRYKIALTPQLSISSLKLAMHKSCTSWRRNPSLIKTTRGGRAKWANLDRQIEIWSKKGIEIRQSRKGLSQTRGYDD